MIDQIITIYKAWIEILIYALISAYMCIGNAILRPG